MDSQSYEAGLKVRTAVLGETHVQRSLNDVDDFNRELQQIVTGFAWGQIWSRPGDSGRPWMQPPAVPMAAAVR